MAEVVLTQADHGASLQAKPGDTITIRLPENATTGYAWEMEEADDHLALENSNFQQNAGGGMGAGGERSLSFRAAQPGETRIRLKLSRPWESDNSNTNRFDVTVRVAE